MQVSHNTIIIKKLNEVKIQVLSEPSIAQELSDYFSFEVPGAKYMDAFRSRMWDGKIRLFHLGSRTIYYGLYDYILEFAKEREYTVEHENIDDFTGTNLSLIEATEYLTALAPSNSKGEPIEFRDYQVKSFLQCIRNKRRTLLSPTASGKSLIIYALLKWYLENLEEGTRLLLIVPTTNLVVQMKSDFEDYSQINGWNVEKNVHVLYSGHEKVTDKPIVISTWQSIVNLHPSWFTGFNVVIIDEAHHAKADSFKKILEKMPNCEHRIGTTGTLDGTKTNKLIIEGLLGRAYQIVTTRELIDNKVLADFKIKILRLKYPDNMCKIIQKFEYREEIDFLCAYEPRNKYITNLSISLTGNTLLLFNFKAKHGKILYEMIYNKIKKVAPHRNVYYVDGDVDTEVRDEIRKIVEKETDAIILASTVFATGTNIVNISNLMFVAPGKGRVKNLQSIGRGLRRGESKTKVRLFDIVDDLSYKGKPNYAMSHYMERMAIYNGEQFDYKIYTISLED